MTDLKRMILDAKDSKTEKIEVPEWGVTVNVTTMSGVDRDSFEGEMHALKGGLDNLRSRLVVRCLCDDEGKRIFDDSDAVELGKKSGVVLCRLFDIARKLNPLSEDDVEKLAGNSESDQSE